jgi:sugar lactone lactonase YvrE
MFAGHLFSFSMDRGILPVYGQQQYSFLMSWGSKGVSLGSFKQPLEIAIDSNGDVYVTDASSVSNQVQKFTNNGTFILSWGLTGLGDGQFINPIGLTTDSTDNVYVGDFGENSRIQKFDGNGKFITKWGSTGSNDGQFIDPISVTVNSSGKVYVVDGGNSRIQVFTIQ